MTRVPFKYHNSNNTIGVTAEHKDWDRLYLILNKSALPSKYEFEAVNRLKFLIEDSKDYEYWTTERTIYMTNEYWYIIYNYINTKYFSTIQFKDIDPEDLKLKQSLSKFVETMDVGTV